MLYLIDDLYIKLLNDDELNQIIKLRGRYKKSIKTYIEMKVIASQLKTGDLNPEKINFIVDKLVILLSYE